MGSVVEGPVLAGCAFALAHVPDMLRHGSKPRRELLRDPGLTDLLSASLRSFEQAVSYPPNQAFIGNLAPEHLASVPRPWHAIRETASPTGPLGEILHQDLFYALLARANVLRPALVTLDPDARSELDGRLAAHPVLGHLARCPVHTDRSDDTPGSVALRTGEAVRGWVHRDARAEGREDDNLDAYTLMEALCSKASGAAALHWLLHRQGLPASQVDYIISCGEEATGDRYQRGGGGMAKAIGEMCGCTRASGMDIKNFCAGPASALVTAAALVKAGVYQRVVVVAGGSLAKLGMKFQALLREGAPLLGDCLGCMAFLVTADDGTSPVIRIDPGAVGIALIGASASDEIIYRQLVLEPLDALGLNLDDIDRFAPELHNQELMELSGSGDVAHKNYRMIAAMAVRAGIIARSDMADFVSRVGMPGFAPPQGHIPSGVPYLGHALESMARGELRRVMVICKASLFLNRLTALYDGVSFIVESRREHGAGDG